MSRILVAGASGVLGRAIVPLLVAQGDEVVGTTRTPEKAPLVEGLGARAEVVDVHDVEALTAVARRAQPELVLSLLTDLAALDFDANSRLRREGTPNLVAAARAAGAVRLAAESIAFPTSADGDAAVAEMERLVLGTPGLEGLVLRYGRLYGPGTWNEQKLPAPPRISVDAAAHATVAAIERGATGVLELVE